MADSPGTRTTRRRGHVARRGAGGVALAALLAAATPAVFPAVAHAGPAAAADGAKPVIVRLEPGSDPDAQARAAAARGARITFVYRDVFPGYAAVLPPGGLRGIEGGPDVVAVDPDAPVRLSGVRVSGVQPPGPAPDPAPWGLDRIDQRARQLSGRYTPPAADRNGLGVTAYVIDSGIEADHDDLDGRVRSGFTAVDDGRGTDDCAGHGTHVAGTIGGATRGVASAVSLVAVRTLDCDGSGETSGVVAGIDWAARDHRRGAPAVANLSLAGEPSDAVDAAVRGLVADGVTVAAAAGNEDADACGSSPGREPSVLTVAATARDDTRAPFSNRGSCVDLFAPGVDVVSDWNTGATSTKELSGTSMASPHVAGAAALLLGAEPTLSPAQVAARLVAAGTRGAVQGARPGDPDRLLYVGPTAGTPAPGVGTPSPAVPATRAGSPGASGAPPRSGAAAASG